jgi:hypothetical protein
MMWSAPATDNMLATSLALMGARDCKERLSAKGRPFVLLAYLVLLVLSRVREAGNDGCDPLGGSDLTGVDHNQEFHEIVVHFSATALNDVNVFSSHGFADLYAEVVAEKTCEKWRTCRHSR